MKKRGRASPPDSIHTLLFSVPFNQQTTLLREVCTPLLDEEPGAARAVKRVQDSFSRTGPAMATELVASVGAWLAGLDDEEFEELVRQVGEEQELVPLKL